MWASVSKLQIYGPDTVWTSSDSLGEGNGMLQLVPLYPRKVVLRPDSGSVYGKYQKAGPRELQTNILNEMDGIILKTY